MPAVNFRNTNVITRHSSLKCKQQFGAWTTFLPTYVGRKFTLITDHRPLEKLGKVHTKTLNRLQEIMNTYDFEITYRKGSEMPADYQRRITPGPQMSATRKAVFQRLFY